MKKLLFVLVMCSSHAHAAYECSASAVHSISTGRYSLINNGSDVLDKQTNLIWQRCLLGQSWDGNKCLGSPQHLTWDKTLIAAKETNVWRIPNVKELNSITEYACHPMVDTRFFDINPDIEHNMVYWSSTPNINNAKEVWVVNFSAYTGEIVAVSAKTYAYPSRLVRNAP
jgi:hypothetical protein